MRIILIQVILYLLHSALAYEQWVADRYNYLKNEPLPYVYGWPVLPITAISEMIQPFPNDLRTTIWLLARNNIDESTQQMFEFRDGEIGVPPLLFANVADSSKMLMGKGGSFFLVQP
jgi:hypothetical protein